MEGEVDLIEFESPSRDAISAATSPTTSTPIGSNNSVPKRRLLVTNWDDSWSRPTTESSPKKTLQSLGDDATYLDALLNNMLPGCSSTVPAREEVLPSAPPLELDDDPYWESAPIDETPLTSTTTIMADEERLEELLPYSSLAGSSNYESPLGSRSGSDITLCLDKLDKYLDCQTDTSRDNHQERFQRNLIRSSLCAQTTRYSEECGSQRRARSVSPRRPRSPTPEVTYPELPTPSPDTSSQTIVYPSSTEPTEMANRADSNDWSDRRTNATGQDAPSFRLPAASGMSASVQPGPSDHGPNSPPWTRQSMRRITHFRLADPPVLPSSSSDQPLSSPESQDQHTSSEQECDMVSESLSPIGQWPHRLSSMLACLACTLGLFNISRFAILSVQFGANFIIQFFFMSLILGIPLFTFHVSIGQLLGAGTMDMWKISPIFQGIGIALILTQALMGIYSVVGVSWMFVYFRDSFITKQDTYRWAEPLEGLAGWRYNSTVKFEETVADYFSGIVLQRHNLESPANTPGHLKFQVTFNLAVVWMIVFISLSKGLKSYGKVVFLFSLVPAFGMLVLCTKLLGLTPHGTRLHMVFPQTDWSEFFLNSKCWTAAMTEAFYTWGLLGASAMQIASHNSPKHLLHRDTSFVTTITLSILILAAFLANTCSQLLHANGYIYVPSSFEKMSTYGFLHPVKSPLPATQSSTPIRWMQHSLYLAGDKVTKPGVNSRQQSGYQALRLATELVPATLAIIGAERLSPFWSVLFYFVLILFGIAQQLAIMHCVITGIMAIKVKTMKSWETTITFFTCTCCFILGLPMATELGIFVVYFLDYCVGGGWWIMLLYLTELIAVFMVRGRPYSGETVVATLFIKAGQWFQNWAAPLLSFTWNVILPVLLMVLFISVFKSGNYRDLFRWSAPMIYDYWPSWSRQLGSLIQLIPLLIIPFIGIVQSCRYLSHGPADVFERIQLLYRPPEETLSASQEAATPPSDAETTSISVPPIATIEDPPPKYTPPPSYTTATGARIAKLLRQSFRRSMRRITNAMGNAEGSAISNSTNTPETLPPPPDYATVLVEINQALSSHTANENSDRINGVSSNDNCTTTASTSTSTTTTATSTTTSLTMNEVAQRLRSSFRRAMRDTIVESSSSQRLVESATPINCDSIIPNQTEDK
ncbi:sodium-dependent transporter bedraggled isoform X2 [Rhodnius prolixus]|uniref:sodium-dependent transporter bedraggled isoform X2 n=1 Tax=Rhodnius prolixus TaxID=13249 RepID=UPI003D18D5FE